LPFFAKLGTIGALACKGKRFFKDYSAKGGLGDEIVEIVKICYTIQMSVSWVAAILKSSNCNPLSLIAILL